MLLSAALLISGCTRVNDIRIDSCNVESLSVKGFKGLSCVLALDVYNPAGNFYFSDIVGRVYLKNVHIADFSAEPVALPARSSGVVKISSDLSLNSGASLAGIMSMLPGLKFKDMDDVTVDLSVRVRRGRQAGKGKGKVFTFTDIPVSAVLEQFKI